jgi:hypothetical protein
MKYDEIDCRRFLNFLEIYRRETDFEIRNDFFINCFDDSSKMKISSNIRIRFSEYLLEQFIEHFHHARALKCIRKTVVNDDIK